MIEFFFPENEGFSLNFQMLYHHFCRPFINKGHKGTVLLLIMKETENKCQNFFFVNA
jgi:hypothetical protein